jgi:hypothetical protein
MPWMANEAGRIFPYGWEKAKLEERGGMKQTNASPYMSQVREVWSSDIGIASKPANASGLAHASLRRFRSAESVALEALSLNKQYYTQKVLKVKKIL